MSKSSLAAIAAAGLVAGTIAVSAQGTQSPGSGSAPAEKMDRGSPGEERGTPRQEDQKASPRREGQKATPQQEGQTATAPREGQKANEWIAAASRNISDGPPDCSPADQLLAGQISGK